MEIFQRPWLSTGPVTLAKPKTQFLQTEENSPRSSSGGGSSVSGASHEYEYRDRLRTWLVKMIESADIPGLTWLNKEKNVFRMPWKHAGRQDYNLEDSKIFMEWAKHSGRYREGIDKPEPIVWKTRLRCALNKMPDIRELPDMSRLDISDPYRVYELLPAMHKGKGADEKIRRRIYKRSSPAITTNENHDLEQPPAKTQNRRSGSTGSQSGSHGDSNDDLSDPETAWFKPLSHPIASTPHSGMTPSTLALSLLNCNPLVANDPVLSTSLTSLATQVLHMEHLIQAYMNQVRVEQAEKSKTEQKMGELQHSLQIAQSERLTAQQSLVGKLIHETPVNLEKHIVDMESNLAVLKAVSKSKRSPQPPLHHSHLLKQLPLDTQLAVLREQLDAATGCNMKMKHEMNEMQQSLQQHKAKQTMALGFTMESPLSSHTSDLEEEIEVIDC